MKLSSYNYKPLDICRAIRRVLNEGDESAELIAVTLNTDQSVIALKLRQLIRPGHIERVVNTDPELWRLTPIGRAKHNTETPAKLGAKARRDKRKTHCKLGHRMMYDTVYSKDGVWRCVTCKKAHDTSEVRRNYFREYVRNKRKRLRDEANAVIA